MERIVECVPNFSEGRDPKRIDEIVKEITGAGAKLLDVQMNPDHNRAVVTFIGDPEIVSEAAFRGCRKAAELIDLTQHKGEHPRIGATDVIPFVPISNISLEECAELARRLGRRIAEELKVPVYLYEAAATRPDRENLANIRKGEFEGLREAVRSDPSRKPDFGNPELHATAGATVVGARFPLIAYNINLNTADAAVAKKIAKAIRFKDGGYRFAKAMGFELKEEKLAQVSINMTNFLGTPLHRVFETVNREAARYGVMIKESEIVGLVPEKALIDAAVYYLQLDRFNENQILEYHLRGQAGGSESLYDFLSRLSDPTPTPGGGSVAALQGALAAGLLAMVSGITLKKSEDPEIKTGLGFLKMEMTELYKFIQADKEAFDAVMKAYTLPKGTPAEKEARNRAVQEAYIGAARVPLTVCRRIVGLYDPARILARKGLKSAISDVGVAAYSLRSGFASARINILINLSQITDEDFIRETRSELDRLSAEEEKYHAEVTGICLTNL
jgi:glutamate formiminotransferase/formiminotetrahydrofolate cyclodeaminase